MWKCIKEHSLSISLGLLYFALKVGAAFTTPEDHFWYATLHGHSDDVLGALIIVLFTKWFYEKNSRY